MTTQTNVPPMRPDVATEPHPGHGVLPDIGSGDRLLQDVLPQITEVAKKVGGFKKLAEIASQLDRAGIGQ